MPYENRRNAAGLLGITHERFNAVACDGDDDVETNKEIQSAMNSAEVLIDDTAAFAKIGSF